MAVGVKTLLLAGFVQAIAAVAAGQTPGDASVGTRTGHEMSVTVGHYTYIEPGSLRISIHGARLGGEYTGMWRINPRTAWFAGANVRGNAGSARYDGWCLPWLIRPSSTSVNGYALGLGSASACSETGDADGYVEARGLVGRDLLFKTWGLSPATGVGLRYLSNGTTGIVN